MQTEVFTIENMESEAAAIEIDKLAQALDNKDYCLLYTNTKLEKLLAIPKLDNIFLIKHISSEVATENSLPQYYLSKQYLKINQNFYKIDKLLKGNVVKNGHKFQKLTYVAANCLIKICYCDTGFYQDSKIDYEVTKKLTEHLPYLEIQAVVDYQLEPEYVILAKKLIPGKDLQKTFNGYSYAERLKVLEQVLKQLADFESFGYQHNDIKADNVMVDEELRAYVIDLGSLITPQDKIKRYDKDYYLRLFTVIHRLFMAEGFNPLPENRILHYLEKQYLHDLFCYQEFIRPFIQQMINIYYSDSTQKFQDTHTAFQQFYTTLAADLPQKTVKKRKYNADTRGYLAKFIQYFPQIHSILELNCQLVQETAASYNFLAERKDIHYCGGDLQLETVRSNRLQFYRDRQRDFMVLDPAIDPLPRADLLVALGVINKQQSLEEQWHILANLRNSQAEYLLIEYAIDSHSQAINLSRAPFDLPAPLVLFPVANEAEVGYQLAVYKLVDVAVCCDRMSPHMSEIRIQLLPILQREYQVVRQHFLQHEQGLQLMYEAFVSTTALDWQKYYYAQPYNGIVDVDSEDGVRDAYISLMLLKSEQDLKRLHNDHGKSMDFITRDNFGIVASITRNFLDLMLNYDTCRSSKKSCE